MVTFGTTGVEIKIFYALQRECISVFCMDLEQTTISRTVFVYHWYL